MNHIFIAFTQSLTAFVLAMAVFHPLQLVVCGASRWRLLDGVYAVVNAAIAPLVALAVARWVDAHVPHCQVSIFLLRWLWPLQVLVLLFVVDVAIYWRHRLFHLQVLWSWHAIHHSSEEVDALATVRFHPLESVTEIVLNTVCFAVAKNMGMPFTVLAGASIVLALNNYLIHSSVPWTYGRWNRWIVSPALHKWHHSTDIYNVNFAAMFACLDRWGGTFYWPYALPSRVGLSGQERRVFPVGFWAQCVYPFKRRKG